MNKVWIIGILTRNPETQETTSGIKYSRFTLAVSRRFSKDKTDFIPVVVWRHQSDFASKYIKKGFLISIEGQFSSSNYVNAEGKTIYKYEVLGENIEILKYKDSEKSENKQMVNNEEVFTKEVNDNDKKSEKEEENHDVPWELDL